MSLELYLAYLVACVVITIVPGPTVTLIVANSLTHGMRACLLNVAGTQLGIAMMMVVLVRVGGRAMRLVVLVAVTVSVARPGVVPLHSCHLVVRSVD